MLLLLLLPSLQPSLLSFYWLWMETMVPSSVGAAPDRQVPIGSWAQSVDYQRRRRACMDARSVCYSGGFVRRFVLRENT
uniref:Putative secreted protein n=1 Tax=Anopheles darlingi TaxID=43151 RepID=A0A2M4DMX9_ANODA